MLCERLEYIVMAQLSKTTSSCLLGIPKRKQTCNWVARTSLSQWNWCYTCLFRAPLHRRYKDRMRESVTAGRSCRSDKRKSSREMRFSWPFHIFVWKSKFRILFCRSMFPTRGGARRVEGMCCYTPKSNMWVFKTTAYYARPPFFIACSILRF